jgi:hypothetical protein
MKGGGFMMGKFVCGMATGLVVGSMMGAAAKCMMDKNEKKMTKKAKKLMRKFENYLNDTMPFMD